MTDRLKAPFPWYGGKSRAADLIWSALGDVRNYIEPFAGSLAVLLARPTEPAIETVNDLDCVAPETRLLRADMGWSQAGDVMVGDELLGFDEKNGPARTGLRAPERYRRFARAVVLGVRRIVKPCYRLTFDDGTVVVASADHLWLGGSHASGGRGWRWLKTAAMVCNRSGQRSWVLKVCDVVHREETFEAGWLSGLFDGEGSLAVGPGLRASLAQNVGPVLARAERGLRERGISVTTSGARRCQHVAVTGGKHEQLALLMRLQPKRLVSTFVDACGEVSLYGRSHRAVGLVSKEFLGDREVMAIETSTRTFIAEGLASHNCYLANFWRAVTADPEAVARAADWPVNEADLHARHTWLVDRAAFRERMRTDADHFDARIAGWWAWGLSCWIGGGWCSSDAHGRIDVAGNSAGRAVHAKRPRTAGDNGGGGVHRRLPAVDGRGGKGVHAEDDRRPSGGGAGGPGAHRRPNMGGSGGGQGVQSPTVVREDGGLVGWFLALQARLRRVRVCCGDWSRVLTPAVLTSHGGPTGVVLDPPYALAERADNIYAEDSDVSAAVRAWAIEHGDDPSLRIVLCGYEGEHSMPPNWRVEEWHTSGGYARSEKARANRHRERLWLSPGCVRQADLFATKGEP